MRQHCTKRCCIPNRINSVRSRSDHNCFPNWRTRTQRKNHLVTSVPNEPFPEAKYNHNWSHARLMFNSRELLGHYRISVVYTHAVNTLPGYSITDRKITHDTRSTRRRKFHPHTRSIHNSHLSARAQNGHL